MEMPRLPRFGYRLLYDKGATNRTLYGFLFIVAAVLAISDLIRTGGRPKWLTEGSRRVPTRVRLSQLPSRFGVTVGVTKDLTRTGSNRGPERNRW
jgi:hypothetical protein